MTLIHVNCRTHFSSGRSLIPIVAVKNEKTKRRERKNAPAAKDTESISFDKETSGSISISDATVSIETTSKKNKERKKKTRSDKDRDTIPSKTDAVIVNTEAEPESKRRKSVSFGQNTERDFFVSIKALQHCTPPNTPPAKGVLKEGSKRVNLAAPRLGVASGRPKASDFF